MADRSVIVALGANVTGLVAGMRTATRAAVDFARNGLDEIARREQSINQLSRSAGVLGVALTGMSGLAVKKFADFDHAMSAVESTGEDARKSIDALREAALAASEQGFTPKDAAEGIENLAKAGVDASDILAGALTGSLDLAAAGALGVAEAAETTSVALTQFNLGGEQATHVADLLAAGAGKAMGDVHDLAYALRMGGLVAAQTGLSIEETTAALASFASAGLLGSDAGTSLKTMLQRLTPRSNEARAQFEQLGISAYDAQGNFIGLENFAGMLQEKMKDLTPEARNAAMSIMFGSDAVRAATVLYDQGASGIRGWIEAVDDQGYAAETAATKLDNLKGDIQLLGATFDRTMIEMGSSADGPLRSLVQNVTGVVDKLGEMPPAAQTALMGIVGGGGLALLGIAGLGKLTVAVSETRTAMANLGVSAKMAGIAAGGIGIALGAGAILLSNWAAKAAEAQANTEAFKDTLDEFGDNTAGTIRKINEDLASTNFGRSIVEALTGMESINVVEWANQAGVATADLTGYILGQEDAVNRVNGALQSYWESFGSYVPSAEKARIAALRDILDEQAGSLTKAQKEALIAATANEELGVTAEGAAGATNALADAASSSAIGIDQVGDAAIEAEKALAEWSKAVADADGAFIDLAGGYQSIIDASREWAEQQAADTESAEDSWEDFYDGVTVSMQDYLNELDRQVAAQQDWEKNMLLLSGRVSQGVIDELARLGPEGAPLVATLVTASDDELAHLETVYGQRASNATQAFAETLRGASPVLAQVMSVAGAEAADAAARALAAGEVSLQDVINQYDLNVVLGASTARAQAIIDMFVSEQSKRQIMLNVFANTGGGGPTKASIQANGSMLDFYAQGGLRESHVAQIAPAGAMRVWAEPETGGEAYIPLAPAKRGRSVDIWRETGRRLGMDVQEFASGGIVGLWQQRLKTARYWVGQAKRWGDDEAVRRAEDRAREAEATIKSLQAERDSLKRSTRRGEVTAQATSSLSGAYSVVNDLWDAAKDPRFTSSQRGNLWQTAAKSEPAMKRLYGQVEKIESKLEAARDRLQELSQIKASVSGALSKEFTLGGMVGQTNQWGYDVPVTSKTILAGARTKANEIKAFATKLDKLRKMGLSGAVLQEVAELGTADGTVVADALIKGGKTDIAALNGAYKSVGAWSDQAGQYVTEGFYKGGVQAAQGLVKGLESEQKALEAQILKVAKGMEKALKKALGINSPSKVTRAIGQNTSNSLGLGLVDEIGSVEKAAGLVGLAAVPDVPSHRPTTLYTASSMAGSSSLSQADMAAVIAVVDQALANIDISVDVGLDRPTQARIVRQGIVDVGRNDQPILKKAVGV